MHRSPFTQQLDLLLDEMAAMRGSISKLSRNAPGSPETRPRTPGRRGDAASGVYEPMAHRMRSTALQSATALELLENERAERKKDMAELEAKVKARLDELFDAVRTTCWDHLGIQEPDLASRLDAIHGGLSSAINQHRDAHESRIRMLYGKLSSAICQHKEAHEASHEEHKESIAGLCDSINRRKDAYEAINTAHRDGIAGLHESISKQKEAHDKDYFTLVRENDEKQAELRSVLLEHSELHTRHGEQHAELHSVVSEYKEAMAKHLLDKENNTRTVDRIESLEDKVRRLVDEIQEVCVRNSDNLASVHSSIETLERVIESNCISIEAMEKAMQENHSSLLTVIEEHKTKMDAQHFDIHGRVDRVQAANKDMNGQNKKKYGVLQEQLSDVMVHVTQIFEEQQDVQNVLRSQLKEQQDVRAMLHSQLQDHHSELRKAISDVEEQYERSRSSAKADQDAMVARIQGEITHLSKDCEERFEDVKKLVAGHADLLEALPSRRFWSAATSARR
eukprot:gnl/TRDRNA2_/TRDRNA2_176468_c0_seq1.p1 gnl/TRDRNA2_/TRDRNA2_176468_c0~~gnl/TRDRNA2_/TRDRNA2_176468_c0_seq1.p1  ORF type:complete len:508 (+),score=100.73 gnl/TRDRNA2_/TRDRNA2_176468_c0_seq1:57-1580(+)